MGSKCPGEPPSLPLWRLRAVPPASVMTNVSHFLGHLNQGNIHLDAFAALEVSPAGLPLNAKKLHSHYSWIVKDHLKYYGIATAGGPATIGPRVETNMLVNVAKYHPQDFHAADIRDHDCTCNETVRIEYPQCSKNSKLQILVFRFLFLDIHILIDDTFCMRSFF